MIGLVYVPKLAKISLMIFRINQKSKNIFHQVKRHIAYQGTTQILNMTSNY